MEDSQLPLELLTVLDEFPQAERFGRPHGRNLPLGGRPLIAGPGGAHPQTGHVAVDAGGEPQGGRGEAGHVGGGRLGVALGAAAVALVGVLVGVVAGRR